MTLVQGNPLSLPEIRASVEGGQAAWNLYLERDIKALDTASQPWPKCLADPACSQPVWVGGG